jgi:hypothetical protein
MPFINGRYYVNPIMGQALEAAREAEAALADLEARAQQNSGAYANAGSGSSDGFGDEPGAQGAEIGDGPIHRVEIEAAELVPSHSGRAAHGYLARVHRSSADGTASKSAAPAASHTRAASNGGAAGRAGTYAPGHAETHVFADHRDLLNFLRDELGKDHSRSRQSS